MSRRKCTADDLTDALFDFLNNYTKEVAENQKKAVDTVAKEVNQEIKDHVSFNQHTGKYVKAFRLKTTEDTAFNKKKLWYVKAPEYRLTHLLENGHALPQGGRAKAYPHIKYGQELAEARMIELSEEAVKNAGR